MQVFHNKENKWINISEVVGNINITTYLEGQPGKCTFEVPNLTNLTWGEGSTVNLYVDNQPVYSGYVTDLDMSEDGVKVTCLDSLWYLSNKDFGVYENVTSSDITAQICQKMVVPYKIVDASTFICPPKIMDNDKYYNHIKYALDYTLAMAKQHFILRCNFGVIEHVNILSLDTNLLIADRYGLESYNLKSSISEKTYNQIKLYTENSKTNKREVYIVNDSINGGDNIRRWGILQHTEKVDEELNAAQIEAKARGMLQLYNRAKRDLKFTGLPGDFSVMAGSLVTVKISYTGIGNLFEKVLVTECSHEITNNEHRMTMRAQVVTLD